MKNSRVCEREGERERVEGGDSFFLFCFVRKRKRKRKRKIIKQSPNSKIKAK